MKRANIKILALILSLIILPPLMWELKSQVGVVPGGSGGVPDNAVQGASNLTTAGAIPYVSSSGTLAQDSPGIHWDATNNRLGLGTASPDSTMRIIGGDFTNPALKISATGRSEYLAFVENGGAGSFITASGQDLYIRTANGSSGINFRPDSATTVMRLNSSLSVAIGPSNTSPSGTLHVYDATATTGSTLVTIARGAAQTASSTVLTMNGVAQFSGTNTTGAGSAALGSNSPAVTNSAPYTWIQVVTSDGSTAYIPAWK